MSNTPSYYNKGGLQPKEVIKRWGLNFFEGNVIKYICRWREKGGQEDLQKAIDNIHELIDVEENPCPPYIPGFADPYGPDYYTDPFADEWTEGGE